MKLMQNMEYRCSCCDEPQATSAGYMRLWDRDASCTVKICNSCHNKLNDKHIHYVKEFIEGGNHEQKQS